MERQNVGRESLFLMLKYGKFVVVVVVSDDGSANEQEREEERERMSI